jgi:hypothetical protein
MSMSHKDCNHPSTSKARAECRKRRDTGLTFKGKDKAATEAYHAEVQELQKQRKSPGKRNVAKANTKAKEKSHVIIEQAIAKLDKRPVCFECSKHAGWIDKRNGQPVCMAHVDWDHARLIPQ